MGATTGPVSPTTLETGKLAEKYGKGICESPLK